MNYDKIIVLGGLGYLGHTVVKALSSDYRDCYDEIVVVDNNVYNRWDKFEIERMGEDDVRCVLGNILQVEPDLVGPDDAVLVCSEIGDSEICMLPEMADYWEAYYKKVRSFSDKADNAIIARRLDSKEHKDWWLPYVKSIPTCELPFMYGTTQSVDISEPINNMVLEFAIYQQYIMSYEPFRMVHVSHVENVAHNLIKFIMNGEDECDYSHIPFLVLCNLVQWEFGQDCSLGIAPGLQRKLTVELTNIQLKQDDVDMLKLLVAEIKAGIENGAVQELMKDRFNSKLIAEKIKNGIKYKDFANV